MIRSAPVLDLFETLGPSLDEAELSEAIARIQTDPLGAADAIEKIAQNLLSIAKLCRDSVGSNPYASSGGPATRVKLQVVGPDGGIKAESDTGGAEAC